MKKIIVISSYPPKGSTHGSKFGGVASYTKNTLNAIDSAMESKGEHRPSYLVLADQLHGYKSYKEGNKRVKRFWKRDDILLFAKLFFQILSNPSYKDVVIAFEFSLFGLNKLIVGMMPIFMFLLRLIGKKVYFISHHVVLDMNEVSGQLGVRKHSLKNNIFSHLVRAVYLASVLASNKTIVFEEHLKQKILKYVPLSKKIIAITHGAEVRKHKITQSQARTKLDLPKNEFVMMSFGFMAWYKGSDWIVAKFAELMEKKKLPSDVTLIMAGGWSRNHKNNPVYLRMINKIEEIAREHNTKIRLTGFVAENEIETYFAASDLIILPYRVMISASGPFSFVLSYKKPFILSDHLGGYAKNLDFQQAMKIVGLHRKEIFFPLMSEGLENSVKYFSEHRENNLKAQAFTAELLKLRSWNEIGKKYANTLNL
ncbi:MAG: hypothetical protein A2770_02670 [Candidatus Levybacteria bacterium RIFCSPHIGHO2_01_FULL_38_12]|nr:MAG: hypothetical protein A2770_02670 [Candidatus Levybacteria bacterium RIFCSPHIGHO2_01_FULL_38_12]